jgi:hypothetical protein
MTGYEDDPNLTCAEIVGQARHYMALYLTEYSGLLRFASPTIPEDTMRKTVIFV